MGLMLLVMAYAMLSHTLVSANCFYIISLVCAKLLVSDIREYIYICVISLGRSVQSLTNQCDIHLRIFLRVCLCMNERRMRTCAYACVCVCVVGESVWTVSRAPIRAPSYPCVCASVRLSVCGCVHFLMSISECWTGRRCTATAHVLLKLKRMATS